MIIKKRIAFLAIFLILGLSTWALAAGDDASAAAASSASSQASAASAIDGEGTGDPFSNAGWLLLAGAAAAGFVMAVVLQVRRKKRDK